MQGQRIGSVRVSTVDQHPERPLEQVPVDRVETDTASGRSGDGAGPDRLAARVACPGHAALV